MHCAELLEGGALPRQLGEAGSVAASNWLNINQQHKEISIYRYILIQAEASSGPCKCWKGHCISKAAHHHCVLTAAA